MTREEKLYSMRMVDLKILADKLGIKINTKAAKSKAVEMILAAEEINKQNENDAHVAEVMQQKKDLGIECPKIDEVEIEKPKLVPMPGTEDPDWGKKHWGDEDTAGDGTPLAEVGKEIAEQAKQKAADAADKPKKRQRTLIEYNGKAQTLTQWAKELDMPVQTLYYRIKMKGWDIEKALTR